MKKLMISTIILLPLIILAILLVSGAIMSLIAHIYVESVEFVDNDTLVLVMNDESMPPQKLLEVNVLPLKAERRDVIFTIEDESIATVDEQGVVTAKFYGETYVTVSSVENAAASAKRKVLVTSRDVHAVQFKEYNAEMYRGESQRLLAEVLPAEASNKNIIWSSSDEEILSVTQSGIVTCNGAGKGDGMVTITATSDDNPEVTATASILCCESLVSISANDAPVATAKKSERFPEIVPYPADATYSVEYTSSNDNIATVDEQGTITFHTWGHVTVTATARDGREHSDAVSVEYDSSYGYFMGPLFGAKEDSFVFDYDAVHAAGGELDISFIKTPEDSYQEIQEVTFSGPDLIEYDEGTEKFNLKEVGETTKLGTVTITVHAKKYDRASGDLKEFDNDVCTVEITRKTSALSFVANGEPRSEVSITTKSVNLSEIAGDGRSTIGVRATPANHTDKISYALEGDGDCASLAGANLTFSQEGTVTVAVTAGTASAKLRVSYTQPSLTDKTVTLSGSAADQHISLSFEDEGSCNNGILEFATPEGYTAKITSDNDDVVSVDGKKLIPHKGGFAKITVTFEPAAAATGIATVALEKPEDYTVEVYVDKSVEAADISFSVGETALGPNEFVTSKTGVTLTVTVKAANGAMEGKELFLDGTKVEEFTQSAGDKVVCTKEITFSGKQSVPVSAAVSYAARATACDSEKTGECARNNCSLRSTGGTLTSGLTVKSGETAFSASGNELTFSDIGVEKELEIEVKDPDPADFVLTAEAISFSDGKGVWFDAETDVRDNAATVTLTSTAGTYGQKPIRLTVAGQTYEISLEVFVPADKIEVKYGDTSLSGGEEYTTFLSELSFTVTLSRTDGKNITDTRKQLSAHYNGEPCTVQQNGENATSFTVKARPDGTAQTFQITGEGGLATFTAQLRKLDIGACAFTYHIEYSYNGAEHKELAEKPITVDGENKYFFPRGLGTFEIRIAPKDIVNRLGGFEPEPEQAEEKHFTIAEESWKYSFHTQNNVCYLEVTVPKDKTFFSDEKLTFKCPEGTATLTLTSPNVTFVEMAGFDSGDKANGGAVYKGYQQVRVFAKHSDYGGGNAVDYFRVPIEVQSEIENVTDPAYAVWNLSSHNDKSGEIKLITTQHGTELTYGGETYTIEETTSAEGAKLPSKLTKTEGGQIIAQGGKYEKDAVQVPWVDVFAEDGYAHIYFGNFGGLSEVDVQNDYFGNFGEKEGWSAAAEHQNDYDGSGRNFAASPNAFSYLRVAVGDGTVDGTESSMNDKESGANIHFNFNVLEEAALVNVFNAAGYYKNANLVLHDNLYGVGELGTEGEPYNKATEKGLFLTEANTPWNSTDSTKLGKTTVYGNGYQINLQAKNQQLIDGAPQEKNNSWGVSFGNLYNVFVKGANQDETVNVLRQKIVLIFTSAYYCDLQGYTKGRPYNSSTAYIKNTVLHAASQSGFQLFYTGEKAYLENVTVVDCAAGITNEQKASEVGADHETNFYFKGNIDVLNYTNVRGVTNMTAGAVSDQSLGMLSGALTSVNDHFEWFGFNCTSDQFNTYNMPYFNLVIYTSNRKGVFNFWNGTSYVKSEDDILYKCSKCGATSANNQFCEMCFQGKMMPAFNYSYGAPEGGAPMKMVLDLSDYKSYLDGAEVTAWTYNYPKVGNKPVIHNGKEATYKVTVDGRLPNMSSTSFQYYRYMFTEERYIRLLCQYVNATDGGATLVKNEEHILWHMQQAYRDKSLLTGRNHDHMAALRESLTGKNITWPDNTTPEQAMQEYDEYHGQLAAAAQMNALLSETVVPAKRAY